MEGTTRPLGGRIIGILGGTSHVVTSAYYDLINAEANRRLGGHDIVETVIAGMNFGDVAALLADGKWDRLAAYVATGVDRLEAAGASLVIGCSNTMHEVMPKVMAGRNVDFLPITAPLIGAINASGVRRVAVLGTRTTMQDGAVMQEVRDGTGATLLTPTDAEMTEINRVIFEELVKGRFEAGSRQTYRDIALRLMREEGAEGVILGCTEIFLLIDQPDLPEMKVFATARLHAEAAVAQVLG